MGVSLVQVGSGREGFFDMIFEQTLEGSEGLTCKYLMLEYSRWREQQELRPQGECFWNIESKKGGQSG